MLTEQSGAHVVLDSRHRRCSRHHHPLHISYGIFLIINLSRLCSSDFPSPRPTRPALAWSWGTCLQLVSVRGNNWSDPLNCFPPKKLKNVCYWGSASQTTRLLPQTEGGSMLISVRIVSSMRHDYACHPRIRGKTAAGKYAGLNILRTYWTA
jgi:hypothetical protein